MNYKRGQMKVGVKASIKQTKPSPMLVTLLYSIVVMVGSGVISAVCNRLTGGRNATGRVIEMLMELSRSGGTYLDIDRFGNMVIGLLMSLFAASLLLAILSFIWNSLMEVGYEGYSLSMVRGEDPSVGRLFCAFPKIGGVLLTRLLKGIFVFLWQLLITVVAIALMVAVMYFVKSDVAAVLIVIALAVAMVVALIWAELRYAFADYILLDYQYSGMEAIRQSKEMMKGNAGRLFVLKISFFGWYLLEGLISALGSLITALLASGQIMYLAERITYGGLSIWDAVSSLGVSMVGVGLAGVVCFLLELWLKPYMAGSVAKLYDMILIHKYGTPTVEEPVASVAVSVGIPAAPAAPVAPEIPAAPAAPVAPETPAAPAVPVVPETPVAPAAPFVPETPIAPAAPFVPETPVTPAASIVPETPIAPAPPFVSGASADPDKDPE